MMLGKISVALLLAASPALAADQEPAQPDGAAEAEAPVAYKTKKVCRALEVVGSSIPRMACTTKRIPIKPAKVEADEHSSHAPDAEAPKTE
jgi:hypothetical protein